MKVIDTYCNTDGFELYTCRLMEDSMKVNGKIENNIEEKNEKPL